MGGILFAGVAPHGWPLIPELAPDAAGALDSRTALVEFGQQCVAAHPDVIVIATPHRTRVAGMIALVAAACTVGVLTRNGRPCDFNVPLDRALTDAVAARASLAGIPIALTAFGALDRSQSVVAID